ncbi:YifB family Mg chelatase-like AAA ATPase [Neorickettsia sp. 179522]|uniref:YifB family Mg chelatase-like AAA ATPase n=1 Tax=Neorickettsia sp. 179522 TaxID=1714371 RepID=UPI0007975B54|nr:YifB family Mg chelatase-like AAA ATPase [Neorickettsia sp. 179522]KYH12262.1 magnesium chelatase [Neorickettsia sp. 179522]
MFTEIHTISIQGLNLVKVGVQVAISPGLPCFNIVGLPDKAVSESKERIRAALLHVGLLLPKKRITVNLSPAGLTKIGTHYDLPIALGVIQLLDSNFISRDFSEFVVLGELSLDASVKGVVGVLPAAVYAKERNLWLVCPWENRIEARISKNKKLLPISSLNELISFLTGKSAPRKICDAFVLEEDSYPDMKDVKGQKIAKRAIEIAAAGGHHLLMRGPPGTGKSMLAKRIVGIMPPLLPKEIMEVNTIISVSGEFTNKIYRKRPFREPHQSASVAAMIGGGAIPKPGEVTLAHNGVLFLDEMAEFSSHLLDTLRQVLETGEVTISRANMKLTYPASFQLIGAMNPCRCGYLGYLPEKECKNSKKCGLDYMKTISGPILDRIDIFVNMEPINKSQFFESQNEEASALIRKRVVAARNKQYERYKKMKFNLNCHMDNRALAEYVSLDNETKEFLKVTFEKGYISLRGHDRILKVARTIADLDGSDEVKRAHLTEALYYRMSRN